MDQNVIFENKILNMNLDLIVHVIVYNKWLIITAIFLLVSCTFLFLLYKSKKISISIILYIIFSNFLIVWLYCEYQKLAHSKVSIDALNTLSELWVIHDDINLEK